MKLLLNCFKLVFLRYVLCVSVEILNFMKALSFQARHPMPVA